MYHDTDVAEYGEINVEAANKYGIKIGKVGYDHIASIPNTASYYTITSDKLNTAVNNTDRSSLERMHPDNKFITITTKDGKVYVYNDRTSGVETIIRELTDGVKIPWFIGSEYNVSTSKKGNNFGEGMNFLSYTDNKGNSSRYSNSRAYRTAARILTKAPYGIKTVEVIAKDVGIKIEENALYGIINPIRSLADKAIEFKLKNRGFIQKIKDKFNDKFEFKSTENTNRVLEKIYGVDSFIGKYDNDSNIFIVWNPEQIHILGSDKDTKMFKEWKEARGPNTVVNSTDMNEVVPSAADSAIIPKEIKIDGISASTIKQVIADMAKKACK